MAASAMGGRAKQGGRPHQPRAEARSIRVFSSSRQRSARQVDLCEVDELRRPAVKNSLHHIHPEMIGLIQGSLRWHGELLAGAHNVDQHGPLVFERGLDGSVQLLRLLYTDATNTHRLGHSREVRILEIAAGVEEAVCLHLHLDKAERAV